MDTLRKGPKRRDAARWTLFVLSGLVLLGCGNRTEQNIKKLEGTQEDREQAMMELVLAKQNAVPSLIAALKDQRRPSEVRVSVVEILFRMYVRESDRRIVPALLEHLDDRDIPVREKVAITLADIGDKNTVGPLLQRLKVEEDDDVRFAVLSSLENLAGLALQPWGDGTVNIEMVEEQKADLVELLKDMARTAGGKAATKAEEILEAMAEDIIQDAEKLVLKGDVVGAEEKLLRAEEMASKSMNVNQKLGMFYFKNGDEEKGIEILRRHGMVAYVRKLFAKPFVDGDLGDPCWRKIKPHRDFFQCIWTMKAYPIEGESEAYIGYTDSSLFVAVKGYEPSTKHLRADTKTRDESALSRDDCVEMFFDTNHDYKTYYHIMVNSIGTVRDKYQDGVSREGDPAWNPEYELAVKVEETSWILEMGIPFREFDARGEKGVVWGFNIARVRITNAAEYGQWVPTYGDAHRPDRFGFLFFE